MAVSVGSCDYLSMCSMRTHTNPYNKGVMFLFTNSADKFSLEIPMPFYQYPLQNRNLEVIVPCEERVAGCIIYYPLSALIAVGA